MDQFSPSDIIAEEQRRVAEEQQARSQEAVEAEVRAQERLALQPEIANRMREIAMITAQDLLEAGILPNLTVTNIEYREVPVPLVRVGWRRKALNPGATKLEKYVLSTQDIWLVSSPEMSEVHRTRVKKLYDYEEYEVTSMGFGVGLTAEGDIVSFVSTSRRLDDGTTGGGRYLGGSTGLRGVLDDEKLAPQMFIRLDVGNEVNHQPAMVSWLRKITDMITQQAQAQSPSY